MNQYKMTAAFTAIAVCAGCLAGCGSVKETPVEKVKKGGFTVSASVHDPSIVKGEDGKYYIFGSHMEAAESGDLREWKSFASGVDEKNPLFDNLFDGVSDGDPAAFTYVGKNEEKWYSVWAPDVIYNKAMGKYVMYFCTTSSFIKSNICFATADDIKGPYTYQDTILYSGMNSKKLGEKTNIYDFIGEKDFKNYTRMGQFNNSEYPNCIDPTIFYDADGRMWMTYGSWSGGIFLLEIDEKTGYPIHPKETIMEEAATGDGSLAPGVDTDVYYGKHLIGGLHNSVEGPYILYDPVSQYYYLFVSYGALTSEGGYQIRLFRSKDVTGPYVDAKGENLGDAIDHSEYGLKMMGNYIFPSLSYTYMAPGHNSAFIDEDGKMYVVYHQRFDDGQEYHEPRVHQMFGTKDGWLVAAPFATKGETLNTEGYAQKEVLGTYYYVNHGTDIGKSIHKYQKIVLEKGGTITGDVAGSYELEKGTPYVNVTLDGQSFTGVMIQMEDEAGNPVMCFTAAGNNNETVWGVHYQ